MNACELADAAESYVGAPFRLHGRDPATGLDCVGVLSASLTSYGRTVHLPESYALRMRTLPDLAQFAAGNGFAPASGMTVPGDVLLVRIGPCQLHLLVATNTGQFVHAHAGLRRVIRGALPAEWPVIAHWRLTTQI